MSKIDISTRTIIKLFGFALLLWFLWAIRDILILLFVVLILVAAFSPTVDYLEKSGLPRLLAVILIYLVLLICLSFLVYLIVPPIVEQVNELTHNLPYYIDKTNVFYSQVKDYLPQFQSGLQNLASALGRFTDNIWSAGLAVFGGIIAFVTVMVLTFYILLEKDGFDSVIVSLIPKEYKGKVLTILHKVGKKMGTWLRGQLLLCLIIAILDFVVFYILNLPFALVLAVLGGILEIIPTIGPILAAIPAIIMALTISPLTAIIVGLALLGIQQLESQILVPKIMGRAMGLSPVIVIIALLIGGKLFGIGGAILAVPAATVLIIIIKEWRKT